MFSFVLCNNVDKNKVVEIFLYWPLEDFFVTNVCTVMDKNIIYFTLVKFLSVVYYLEISKSN